MLEVEGVTLEKAVRLGQNGVRSAEDLAGLLPDEYRFIFMDVETEVKLDDLFDMADHEIGRLVRQSPVTADEANQVIMAARVSVYGEDVIAPEPEVEGTEEESAVTPVDARSAGLAEAEAVFAPQPTPADVGE